MKKNFFLSILLLSALVSSLRASVLKDSVEFSILTCHPSSEIYRMFGHTAIRYQNFTQKQDVVFNFGTFDFSAPNFLYHFVKGETDYFLACEDFGQFCMLYTYLGATVNQQRLNLDDDEKIRLWNILAENIRPENRTYRYNYFFDNCTTRARDRIEDSVEGGVTYDSAADTLSFRQIVHQYTSSAPWYSFGIDMMLGEEADRPIAQRQQMFAPQYFHDAANKARKGNGKPLVKSDEPILLGDGVNETSSFPLPPMQAAWILFATSLALTGIGIRRGKLFWWWELLLFGLQGAAGVVIAFLFFISIHPTVGSNWMIGMLNPIPLVMLPLIVYCTIKQRKTYYHAYNAVALVLFLIVMPCGGQYFHPAVAPLALSLLAISGGHLFMAYVPHKKHRNDKT
ncbi:MAG: DUF4105 domain-containing protein [Bacteroidales bacterium]|nr:DUF4105 domain-containing protein [Bacteroidales bacterium]